MFFPTQNPISSDRWLPCFLVVMGEIFLVQLCRDRLLCDGQSWLIWSLIPTSSLLSWSWALLTSPSCSHTPELLRLLATDPVTSQESPAYTLSLFSVATWVLVPGYLFPFLSCELNDCMERGISFFFNLGFFFSPGVGQFTYFPILQASETLLIKKNTQNKYSLCLKEAYSTRRNQDSDDNKPAKISQLAKRNLIQTRLQMAVKLEQLSPWHVTSSLTLHVLILVFSVMV